jgi:hypothetical protein
MSSGKVLQKAEANYKHKMITRTIASNLVTGNIPDSKHCSKFAANSHVFTNMQLKKPNLYLSELVAHKNIMSYDSQWLQNTSAWLVYWYQYLRLHNYNPYYKHETIIRTIASNLVAGDIPETTPM